MGIFYPEKNYFAPSEKYACYAASDGPDYIL